VREDLLRYGTMRVTALAGGIGAGKFLRGVVRAAPGALDTVIVNTGDDCVVHGLHVSPDLDSVCYWLSGRADRLRGWGLANETFHAMEELRATSGVDAWFNLGDRDLATHLLRTDLLRRGASLSEATARLVRDRFRIATRILPMSDDRVTTRVECVDGEGVALDLHFQEYWVKRRAADAVKRVRYEGAGTSRPAPGVLEAIRRADVVLLCPSNPVASIMPILGVPGIRPALEARADAVGISPIVGGAPVAGMADKLMPSGGFPVSALGAARPYHGILAGWVVDTRDRDLAAAIEEKLRVRVAVTDTIMSDDARAAALAAVALELARA
jgi:LPPG:FO 2-phospho-L-lactate transferase